MRIWDINPGYLNRQSLLGEHRELHGIVSIIANNKRGYSNHPETLRWIGCHWALQQRHRLLIAEMALRGFTEKTPLPEIRGDEEWPTHYIDSPFQQFKLLEAKYLDKEPGRIPLPKNAQQLWSQHKYSVLARDEKSYREIGRDVAQMNGKDEFEELAMVLSELLRQRPANGPLMNALQHMWGHLTNHHHHTPSQAHELLLEIQRQAIIEKEPYLLTSTALSELMAWLPE